MLSTSLSSSHSPCCVVNNPARAYRENNRGDQAPTKDRFPPRAYDPANPKRRLAVLIDANKVEADTFCRNIEPALQTIGFPILIRVFDHDLTDSWRGLIGPGRLSTDEAIRQSSPQRSVPGVAFEYFRVEKFIPISMQIGADANHIFEFRSFNKIEGVCYVCTELERPKYELLFARIAKQGFNQYCFDELGLGSELLEDNRSRDGS